MFRCLFFQARGSLTSLKSQTRDPQIKVLPEDLCSGFLRPEKIHRTQPDLNPRTLDLETSTLSRDHRGRHCGGKYFLISLMNQLLLLSDYSAVLGCLWDYLIPFIKVRCSERLKDKRQNSCKTSFYTKSLSVKGRRSCQCGGKDNIATFKPHVSKKLLRLVG